jgi:hypothetical protein
MLCADQVKEGADEMAVDSDLAVFGVGFAASSIRHAASVLGGHACDDALGRRNDARVCARLRPQIERIIRHSFHEGKVSTFIRGMLSSVATLDLCLNGLDQIRLDDVLARA